MFSKTTELTGLGLITWGVALLLGFAAGIIFLGISLVFVGSMTNDDAVGLVIRRGWGSFRFRWHRRLLIEDGEQPFSPQPEIKEDPIAKAHAEQMARQRLARARIHDQGDALSRTFDYLA